MAGPATAAPFVVACTSLVMGTCNLVVLGLPAGWRLAPAGSPPEVDRWRVHGDVCWALEGRASFVAWGPHPGGGAARLAGEVEVAPLGSRAARRLADPALALQRVEATGVHERAGHAARWALGAVRRGLGPWTRWAPALALAVACPQTGRQLRVRWEGGEPRLLAAVQEAAGAVFRCC